MAREVDPLRQRRIAYRGISRGVLFICAGIILLLNVSGRFGWGVWWDLLRFWPILLISLGLRLIFVNSRLHPLCLLGPLLVVATTVWVLSTARGGSGADWSRYGEARTEAIECPQPTGPEPAAQPASCGLDVEFAAGRLDLRVESVAAGSGISGTLRHTSEPASWSCRDRSLRIRRRGDFGHFHFFNPFADRGARWEGDLRSAGPVDLRADLAASTAEIDLRPATLLRAEISSAASRLRLRFGPPRGQVPIRLDGAVSDLRLVFDEGTCVEIEGDWAVNSLRVEGLRRRHLRSRAAATRACDTAGPEGPRYEVRYDLPVSSIRIETEPAAG